MYILRRLSQVFEAAEQIPFDDTSRIILMSDCHRGDGSWADDFSRNQHIYIAALTYYYDKNYTYIELGDGDELWKSNNISDIMSVHNDAFELLSRFFKKGRLYLLYGNHDMAKKNHKCLCRRSNHYFHRSETSYIPLFESIRFHEGLILKYSVTEDKIFLLHGHQADYFNDDLWRLSRFLVKYFWRPLEIFGVNDPTSAAKNYRKKDMIEKILVEWVRRNNQMIIAAHTHRPMFPKLGEPPYFNDGSCVHPRCITGIEISEGNIILVKWSVKTRNDGTMFVGREVIAGPGRLKDYFNFAAADKES